MKKIILTLLVGAFLLVPNIILADSYELPFIMASQNFSDANKESGTKVEYDGSQFFGGMGANQVINNYFDPNQPLLGFDKVQLNECIDNMVANGVLPNVASCFLLTAESPIKLMTSKTEANGSNVYELASLVYSPNIIYGDAFTNNFDNNNFAFYGRHLNQSSSSSNPSNGSWNVQNYAFNPEAQSSYSSAQSSYLISRVLSLASEAQNYANSISLRDNSDWWLQGSEIFSGSNNEASLYPDGKVWVVKDSLVLSRKVTIHGKGTIIFIDDSDSSLTLESGARIARVSGDESSSLGIIVAGKSGASISDNGASLNLAGNNAVDAAVLVFGSINKTGTTGIFEGKGSFVANSFSGFDASNGFSKFSYDYKLEQNWPPGFRYFNMPHAENSSPN